VRRGDPVTTRERPVVAALEQAIVQRIGEPRYNLWFAKHTQFAWQDDQILVGVPNLHFQEWLESKFASDVAAAAAAVFGRVVPVRFAIEPALFQAARREQQATSAIAAQSIEQPTKETGREASGKARETPRRNRRWHRLHDFVVGACNRVAHASALSLIEAPGQGPNPLVLHGPVGTGKTHLLEGVYAGLRKAHPDWDVRFVTAEEFTNSFLHAMHAGKLGAFRRRFRDYDAKPHDFAFWREGPHEIDLLVMRGSTPILAMECKPSREGVPAAVLSAFRKRFPRTPLIVASLLDASPRRLDSGLDILPWRQALERYRTI